MVDIFFGNDLFSGHGLQTASGGTVMTEEEFRAYIATVSRYNAIQIGEATHLVDVPTAVGGMNHCCDANLWMRDAVTVVARRDIAAGEELTQDYAL